jgi:hypothetical protein
MVASEDRLAPAMLRFQRLDGYRDRSPVPLIAMAAIVARSIAFREFDG